MKGLRRHSRPERAHKQRRTPPPFPGRRRALAPLTVRPCARHAAVSWVSVGESAHTKKVRLTLRAGLSADGCRCSAWKQAASIEASDATGSVLFELPSREQLLALLGAKESSKLLLLRIEKLCGATGQVEMSESWVHEATRPCWTHADLEHAEIRQQNLVQASEPSVTKAISSSFAETLFRSRSSQRSYSNRRGRRSKSRSKSRRRTRTSRERAKSSGSVPAGSSRPVRKSLPRMVRLVKAKHSRRSRSAAELEDQIRGNLCSLQGLRIHDSNQAQANTSSSRSLSSSMSRSASNALSSARSMSTSEHSFTARTNSSSTVSQVSRCVGSDIASTPPARVNRSKTDEIGSFSNLCDSGSFNSNDSMSAHSRAMGALACRELSKVEDSLKQAEIRSRATIRRSGSNPWFFGGLANTICRKSSDDLKTAITSKPNVGWERDGKFIRTRHVPVAGTSAC